MKVDGGDEEARVKSVGRKSAGLALPSVWKYPLVRLHLDIFIQFKALNSTHGFFQ